MMRKINGSKDSLKGKEEKENKGKR